MKILPDPQLETVLASASTEHLRRLADICHLDYGHRSQSPKRLVEDIIGRVQLFGSTPSKNQGAGQGVLYADIVKETAKRIKIKGYKIDNTETIEWNILSKFIPTVEYLPLSAVEDQINNEIDDFEQVDKERWKKYIPTNTAHKQPFLNKALEHLFEYSNIQSTTNVLEESEKPVVEFCRGTVIYTSFKFVEPTISKPFQKPLYEIIVPAVLYISFLRVSQKICRVARKSEARHVRYLSGSQGNSSASNNWHQ